MMSEAETLAHLNEIFEDLFEADPITPATRKADVDGWDSLGHVRMLLAVEKKFQIRFQTSEYGGIETIGDILSLIRAKQG